MNNIISDNELEKRIDVYILSVNEEENIHSLTLAQDMRLNGLLVETNTNNLSMKSQFKIADNLHATFLVILNSEDLQKGIITVKDNATKEEYKLDETEVVDWLIGNI